MDLAHADTLVLLRDKARLVAGAVNLKNIAHTGQLSRSTIVNKSVNVSKSL